MAKWRSLRLRKPVRGVFLILLAHAIRLSTRTTFVDDENFSALVGHNDFDGWMAFTLAPEHFRKYLKYEKKNDPYSGEDPADNVATTTEHEQTKLLLRDKRRNTWVARANSTGNATGHDQLTRKCTHRDLVVLE